MKIDTQETAPLGRGPSSIMGPKYWFLLLFGMGGFAAWSAIERKRAEAALRKNERYFRTLIENNLDLITVLDSNGIILYENRSIKEVLGYEPEERTGKSSFELVHPDDLPIAADLFARGLQDPGTVLLMECRFRHKDGTWRLLKVTGVNLLHDSAVAGIVVNSYDITKRKRAEIALQESEERFSVAFRANPNPMCISTLAEGQFIEVNESFLQTSGYTLDEVIGHNSLQLNLWVEPAERDRLIQTLKEQGTVRHLETYFRMKNGAVRTFLLSAEVINCGGEECLLTALHDITKSKRVEEALKESEDRYRDLVEHSQELICTHDLAGRILSVNPWAAKVLGYTPSSLMKKNIRDGLLPELRAGFDQYLADIQRDGFAKGIMLVQTSTGETRIWEYNNTLRTQGVATPIVRGMAHDITERKRAEEALKQSERDYRELFETAHDAIIIFDPDGEIVLDINKRACEIYGFSRSEFIGMSLKAISQDVAYGTSRINATLESGTYHNFETVQYRKDGSEMFLDINASVVTYKGQRAIQSINRDSTERKRAERALQRSEQYFRALIERSSDIVSLLDINGVRRYISPSVERVLGYKAEELIGKSAFDLIHPDDVPDLVALFSQELDSLGSSITLEFRCRHKDGAWRIMEATGSNYLHDAVVDGIVVNSRDITARKRAEEQLRQSQTQMRALSAHLQFIREEERTYIAREIHDELGQSLTALKIDFSWLSKRLSERNDGSASQLLAKIESMSNLIDSTVQSVRKISTELRPAVLDTVGLVAAVEWQALEFQDRTEVDCNLNLPAKDIALDQGRSSSVFRIFQEILTNIARHANATSVEISLKHQASELILEVRDNGRGITENKINDALSLGLLGMRERARLLGGEVKIEGVEGKTTVIARIPLADRRGLDRKIDKQTLA